MKQVFTWLVIAAAACAAVAWYANRQVSRDRGVPIGLAFGNSADGNVEMHVIVSSPMVNIERPKREPRGGAVLWIEWIAEHFDVRDQAGDRVDLWRKNFSSLIPDKKAANPEFYLHGKLRAGETYTFEYRPKRDESKHYRHTFSVPTDGRPFERVLFEPADGAPG